MKINLTKKDYETLLDVLYITDWITRAHEEETEGDISRYKEFEQKIFALAGEFGFKNKVAKNNVTGSYYLTNEHLNSSDVIEIIENFENATFWEELLERLTRRDFIRRYGEKAILEMSIKERFEKEMEFLERYDKEFSENGLENVVTLGVTGAVETKEKN